MARVLLEALTPPPALPVNAASSRLAAELVMDRATPVEPVISRPSKLATSPSMPGKVDITTPLPRASMISTS